MIAEITFRLTTFSDSTLSLHSCSLLSLKHDNLQQNRCCYLFDLAKDGTASSTASELIEISQSSEGKMSLDFRQVTFRTSPESVAMSNK